MKIDHRAGHTVRLIFELAAAGRISLIQRGKAWYLKSRYVDLLVSDLHHVSNDDLKETV